MNRIFVNQRTTNSLRVSPLLSSNRKLNTDRRTQEETDNRNETAIRHSAGAGAMLSFLWIFLLKENNAPLVSIRLIAMG